MEVEESEKFCFEVNDDDDVLDFEIVLLLLSSVFFGFCIVWIVCCLEFGGLGCFNCEVVIIRGNGF